MDDSHSRKEFEQTRRKLQVSLLVWTPLGLGCALLFFLLLRVYNVYPSFYAPARQKFLAAQREWRACQENHLTHSMCNEAYATVSKTVSIVALEDTLYSLLGHFNPLGFMSQDGTLRFVVLHALDNILSSAVLLMVLVVCVAALLVYTFVNGPGQSFQRYRFTQDQLRALQESDCVPLHTGINFTPDDLVYSTQRQLGYKSKGE